METTQILIGFASSVLGIIIKIIELYQTIKRHRSCQKKGGE